MENPIAMHVSMLQLVVSIILTINCNSDSHLGYKDQKQCFGYMIQKTYLSFIPQHKRSFLINNMVSFLFSPNLWKSLMI